VADEFRQEGTEMRSEEAHFTTYVRGERVELPATIDGIRAALPEDRREQFDREVGAAPAGDLPRLLAHWALETNDQAVEDMDATFERLARGDFSGCVPQDDTEAGAA
jgi:hypothetical protein